MLTLFKKYRYIKYPEGKQLEELLKTKGPLVTLKIIDLIYEHNKKAIDLQYKAMNYVIIFALIAYLMAEAVITISYFYQHN
jgi:hypothetical protein